MVVTVQLGHTDARLVLQRYGNFYPGAAAQAAMSARPVPASANTALASFIRSEKKQKRFRKTWGLDPERLMHSADRMLTEALSGVWVV